MSYPSDDEVIPVEEFEPEPWSQHDKESDKNYKAFQAYRDLGRDRSMRKAYLVAYDVDEEEYDSDQAPSHIYSWAKKFSWKDRAKKWDEYLDEKKQEEMEEEMIEHSKTMMKNSQIVGDSVLKGLKSRLEGKDPEEVEKLIFDDDGLSLEGISRTLATIKSVASEAYGQLSDDDENDDADATLKIIEEAINE